ncbi:UNVERIFIED_CONTAM: MazG-like nucleotide pyrophosphohydrolase family protein [Acetivibrio alkalicellulosi]
MNLSELIDKQKKFDSKHVSRFDWDVKIDENNIEMLEFLLLSLTGELGETANIVKKIRRGDFTLADKISEISEELADMLIYILKISYQLDIDIEKAYINKMSKNVGRFKHYERD